MQVEFEDGFGTSRGRWCDPVADGFLLLVTVVV